jgi:excisionase family DNA binding protein
MADRIEARIERIADARASGQALDVKQAAARLGVSVKMVQELVASGEIRSVKVGRRRLIAASTIDRLLAGEAPSVAPR